MKKIFSVLILTSIVLGLIFVILNGRPAMNISGVVMPHHDLVKSQRAELFAQLVAKLNYQPQTIILVSPNHYYTGQGKIQTTNKTWEITGGQIEPDQIVIDSLLSNKVASNETGSFLNEHGIYNILGDIKQNFPQVKLVPVILKNPSMAELTKLETTLNKNCQKCLIITSVDFSHYQPALLAGLHDQKSIRALQNLDEQDLIKNVEVDSGSALALLSMWARDHGTVQFDLKNRTDSDLLLNQPNADGTSHVFGWYQKGAQIKPEQFISFVISSNLHVGEEDRTIWGTDVVINKPPMDFPDLVVAGKLTPQGIEFFGLPKQLTTTFYERYKDHIVSSPGGDVIKIQDPSLYPLYNLSPSNIESKIKSVINLK